MPCRLITLVVLGMVLAACGPGSSESAATTVTPVATVAPNARVLPDETTVVEAAPVIETAESEATEIVESVELETTDVAQELDQEATQIVRNMREEAAEVELPTPADADVRVMELGNYIGDVVAVRGSITERIGQHAFLIRDPVLLDGDEALVIYDQSDFALAEGQTVLVSSEVRPFNLTELERETGLDLPDEQLTALQTDLVLVAQSIIQVS
jgi:hypothetical protein